MEMSELGIKICGITTPEDAVAARELGAYYLGMILSQGFARSILPDEAVDIGLVAGARLVAVLVDESLDEAERIAGLSCASVIQLHGEEDGEYAEELRRRGEWAIWKAVRVRDPEDVTRAVEALGASVDGLLLDGWHPDRPGGSGASFSWEGARLGEEPHSARPEGDRCGRPHAGKCGRSGPRPSARRRRRQLWCGAKRWPQGSEADPGVRP